MNVCQNKEVNTFFLTFCQMQNLVDPKKQNVPLRVHWLSEKLFNYNACYVKQ